jgi:hypothetical protein
MKRKLLALALLLAVTSVGLSGGHPAEAAPGNCTMPYCNQHPNQPCVCPPGTKLAGEMLICPATIVDCNLL